jgi:restriction endonuclease S subunit
MEGKNHSDWTRVAFGDVVSNGREASKDPESDGLARIVGLDHLEPGSLRLYAWDELDELPDGTSFSRVFRAGQVLFGKRRAYQRKVAVPDFDGVCSGDLLVFASRDESKLLPEFLPCIVQSESFFEHALSTSAGSLSPRTSWKGLSEFEFDLPPLDEQRRIVELLAAAEDAVRASEELPRALAIAISAQLEEWSRRSSRVSLVDLAVINNGPRKPVRSDNRAAGNVPYCGANGVQGYVSGSTHSGTCVLVAEDAGYWGPRCQSSYVTEGEIWVNNHAHVLQTNTGVDARLVSAFLNHIDLRFAVAGTTRGKLTRARLESLEIPDAGSDPLCVETFQRLVRFKSVGDERTAAAQRTCEALRNELLA